MDGEPLLVAKEVANPVLRFKPQETRTPTLNYLDNQTQENAFDIQVIDDQHLVLSSKTDHQIYIDLTEDRLQVFMAEAILVAKDTPASELQQTLYKFTTDRFGQNTSFLDTMLNTIPTNGPINICDVLSNSAANCFERLLFTTIVTQALTGQSQAIDCLIPKTSEFGGHATYAKKDTDPVQSYEKLKDFFNYDQTIGMVQRIILF